jgi:DNA gyrase subunit B
VKTAITNFVKKQFKGEFDGDLARAGLVYAVSCKIPNPSFANQTKTKINNPELRGIAQRATGTALDTFMNRRPNDFKAVMDALATERKAEQAAERARRAVLEKVKEVNNAGKKGMIDVDKLADAENLGENAVLLLVEGKSAGGAMQRVRDPKKYGILKLRGKIINALSNDMDKVLANEEVTLFLKATGINISNYKESKFRYGKVAICVDADDDGMHIACLIMALLYKFAPEFLKEGRLYWLHAPLFKVANGKSAQYFYTEEQVKQSKAKGAQTRFKGLGEMKDEDARCMFNENQWLEQLTWDDSVAELLEGLMGDDSQPKKDFVFSRINFEEIEI